MTLSVSNLNDVTLGVPLQVALWIFKHSSMHCPPSWRLDDVNGLSSGLMSVMRGLSGLLVLHLEQIAVNVIDVTEQVQLTNLTRDETEDIFEKIIEKKIIRVR